MAVTEAVSANGAAQRRTPVLQTITAAQAVAFIERSGIVLEAARRGHIPVLVDAIAGETVHGNWWSHAESRAIFRITRHVRESPQVLVCRLLDGKITLVHERLWPALVHISEHLPRRRLARLHEVHTVNGRHRVDETPFPRWVPEGVLTSARRLTESRALATLDAFLPELGATAWK